MANGFQLWPMDFKLANGISV